MESIKVASQRVGTAWSLQAERQKKLHGGSLTLVPHVFAVHCKHSSLPEVSPRASERRGDVYLQRSHQVMGFHSFPQCRAQTFWRISMSSRYTSGDASPLPYLCVSRQPPKPSKHWQWRIQCHCENGIQCRTLLRPGVSACIVLLVPM